MISHIQHRTRDIVTDQLRQKRRYQHSKHQQDPKDKQFKKFLPRDSEVARQHNKSNKGSSEKQKSSF